MMRAQGTGNNREDGSETNLESKIGRLWWLDMCGKDSGYLVILFFDEWVKGDLIETGNIFRQEGDF